MAARVKHHVRISVVYRMRPHHPNQRCASLVSARLRELPMAIGVTLMVAIAVPVTQEIIGRRGTATAYRRSSTDISTITVCDFQLVQNSSLHFPSLHPTLPPYHLNFFSTYRLTSPIPSTWPSKASSIPRRWYDCTFACCIPVS